MSTFTIKSFGHTYIGPFRNNNEDEYILLPEQGLFVLADGMGGHRAGEIAAKLAIKEFSFLFLNKQASKKPIDQIIQDLHTSILDTNKKIYKKGREKKYRGMGTTFCLLYLINNIAIYAHIGDSRVYRYREGNLIKLTEDHSLVYELQTIGHLDLNEPIAHPYKNVITKALGSNLLVEPEIFSTTVKTKDIFILCSDGLSDFVSDEEISQLLVSSHTIEDAAYNLIEVAKENKSNDNISVVLVEINGEKSLSG